MDEKDLRKIKNMFLEQAAAMRVDGEIHSFHTIKCGARQGHALLYFAKILLLPIVK